MSAIDPVKKAAYDELVKRRDSLSPDKQALLDELGKRFATPPDQSMTNAMQQVRSTIPTPSPISSDPNDFSYRAFDKSKPMNTYGGNTDNLYNAVDVLLNAFPNASTGMEPTGSKGLDFLRGSMASGIPGDSALAGAGFVEQLKNGPVVGTARSLWQSVKMKYAPEVNNWLGVSKKAVARGADPGARLLKENLVAATKEATEKNVSSALDNAGQQLGSKLEAATTKGETVNVSTDLMDALVNASKKIGKRSDVAFQGQLMNQLSDILRDFPNPESLTPVEAHALKVRLGDSIKWSGQAFDDDLNQVLVKMYGSINDRIKTSVSGVAAAQERWGDLYIAKKAIEDSMNADTVGAGTGRLLPIFQKAKTTAKYGAAGTAGAGLVEGFRRVTR